MAFIQLIIFAALGNWDMHFARLCIEHDPSASTDQPGQEQQKLKPTDVRADE